MSGHSRDPLDITVLISGQGSNLQALIDAQDSSSTETTPDRRISNAQITHVISNRKNAFGLERAKKANIPTTYHNLVAYKKQQADTEEGVQRAREAYDRDLAEIIIKNNNRKSSNGQSKPPNLIVCAGWMHILSSGFVDSLHKIGITIINLHPALPGKFNGADAIHRAYGAFQRGEITETGVMVHHVISEVDMGEPILVREVECSVVETETDLETRIHAVEWEIIVDATIKVLKEIEGRMGVDKK